MRTNGPIQLYPFLRIALCLIVGILLGDATVGMVAIVMWQWLFVGLLSTLFILYIFNRSAVAQTVLLFCVIVVGGAWRVACYERQQWCAFSGEEEHYEAVVLAHPVEKKRSFKCELTVVSGRMAGHKVNAYFQRPFLEASSATMSTLSVGDGIVATSVFSPFDDEEPQRGGFDWSRQRMVRGIVARTFVRADCWQRTEVSVLTLPVLTRLSLRLQSLRQHLLLRLRRSGISEEAYATIAAMTLGDKTTLTAELRDTYSRAGVAHLLALSGLHLSIIYGIFFLVLGRWRNTILGFVLIVVLIWFFALMVGMSPGIVRSALMFTLCSIMAFLSRGYITLNSLATAATVMLIASPLMLWDIGFQMSFVAVLGIVLCLNRFYDNRLYWHLLRHRVWGKIFPMVAVAFSAQIFVLPLVMYYFGRVPLYFLLSNIVAVPVATIVIYVAVLLFVLSPLCSFAQCIEAFWLFVANGVGGITTAMNIVLAWIARQPGASFDGAYINIAQLFLLYALIVALFVLWRYFEKMWESAHGTFKL